MNLPCEKCFQGSILEGTPRGVYEGPAYFKVAPSPSKRAVILLTDVFGLKIPNPKLIADKLSDRLACDVWVPDLFEGKPPATEAQMAPVLTDVPGTSRSLMSKLNFYRVMMGMVPALISNRPKIVDNRITTFARRIKLERHYEKIGVIGYCFGGAQAIRLGAADFFDSAVVAHPGICSEKEIAAMRIPVSWICAEEDFTFGPKLRAGAEKIMRRKQDLEKFQYEFRDYKGTVHGFACRPNLGIPVVKEAFERAFEQAAVWFEKTLQVS